MDLHIRHRPLNECKREYVVRYGLTARQFNAIAAVLKGKVNRGLTVWGAATREESGQARLERLAPGGGRTLSAIGTGGRVSARPGARWVC